MDHFLVDYENIGEAGLKGIEDLGSDTSTVIFYSEHADKISFDMHQVLCRCASRLEFRKAQTGKKNALDFQLSTYLGYLVASHPGDRFFIISKDNGYHVVMDFWESSTIQQIDYIGRAYERPSRQAPGTESKAVPSSGNAAEIQETRHTEPFRQQDVSSEEISEVPSEEASSGREKAVEAETLSDQPTVQAENGNQVNTDQPEPEKRTHRGGRRRNSAPREPQADEFKPSEELMNSLSQLIESEEERKNIGRFIVKYKTKQGVNNAIVKMYGTEKAGELYRKIKPLLKDKKGK